MRMIQKVALNSLKLGYVQVEIPKFPRPCTLACNCKIIWASDSGQVGEWSRKFRNHTGREAFEKIMLKLTKIKNTLEDRNFRQKKIQKHPRGEASRKIMLNFNFTKDFPIN